MTSSAEAASEARAESLARSVRQGDIRIAARLMRDLDDQRPLSRAVLRRLWPGTGRAFILGITGNPGAGKSTVVDGLIEHYRGRGQRVGVVVIDPTSPFSGGAILGDRIRMQRHATDEGVFIRSLATRGHLGGVSRSTAEVVSVLDAMGYDPILIETVGVGQGEVDIVSQADTAVVVTVPGLGDEVQAIKAGILEIADVLVVNKADREGADRSVRDLLTMLDLRGRGGEQKEPVAPVEVVRTVAIRREGLLELVAAIDRHRDRTRSDAATQDRKRSRVRAELRDALVDRLKRLTDQMLEEQVQLVQQVEDRTIDPFSAADLLLGTLGTVLRK